jgi:Dicarboxylate transport
VLRYKPERLPPQIAAAGEQVALALRALGDFHYESLALDLDKSAGGDGKVMLRVTGRNPDVDPGQEFIFNIALASNFDRLAELAVLSIRSAQQVLRDAAGRVRP